jgi:CheY-like chemotaxis protein
MPLLMLIDIGLPGMNGYELARRLRQLPQLNGATLIALTGREGPTAQEQALFDQFWTKPFDPRRLIAEVKAVINRAATRSPA